MIYRFDRFDLDTAKVELRADGAVIALEPQVFALLALLVANSERLVSREEIIDTVWDGRIVSDAAVASRIKSARQSLGDDGASQRFIRTLHRQGLRFVAPVRLVAEAEAAAPASAAPEAPVDGAPGPLTTAAAERPSIAVLPFHCIGAAADVATIADALPYELIVELSRLRWLFVTARGSSFRLRAPDFDWSEVGRLLGVRYALCGSVRQIGTALAVTAELVDTRDGGVVFAERFEGTLDDVHRIRWDIRTRILAALEIHIPMHEALLARLRVSESLDAWSAYHLGVQHMYRFNRSDNAAALEWFRRAVKLDPSFARAHAGLSFVHFQAAFLRHTDDLASEVAATHRHAALAVELDPIDPFVNFTMGRSFWLDGALENSLSWLERATSINPNYAQGHYARGWAESLAGRGLEGRERVDLAMRLSPLDPLYYAMLGTRALTHIALGEDVEAALWAERAARAPGAHVLIAMIAAAAHALAGNTALAEAWAADVRTRNATLSREDFFRSFPMKTEAMRARVAAALRHCGFR